VRHAVPVLWWLGPLSDATAVSAVLSLTAALAIDTTGLMPSWPEHAWLLLLALSSQVTGWILISASLPRLPAALTSVLLTIQPLGSMLLGIAIFAEAPSALQVAGVAAILAGLVLVGRARPTPDMRVDRLWSRNGPCALGGWEGASPSACLETRSMPTRALRFLARSGVRATRPFAERLRAGARRYGTVLAVPNVRVPLAVSALGSLPIGIYVLGILLLAREATGSFAEAGLVAGAFGLANALGAVAQGRAMDRLGQPRVLRAVATVHASAVAALLFATRSDAAQAILIACAATSGGSLPQLPAAMRALWPTLISDESDRQTAYASGAIAFGVAVVAAPALVAGLVVIGSPGLAVGVAAGIAGTAALTFSATAASRRWQGAMHATGWLGPLTAPGVRTIFGAMMVLGLVLGVVQVAVPAVTAEADSTALAGVLLAVMSAGSLVGGIAYGSRSWPGGVAGRLAVLFAALALGCALLTVAAPLPIMAVILFAVGLLLAPITIISSSLLDIVAPRRAITEAFSILIMGDVAGTAAGTAIAGTLIDATSVTTAVAAAAATAVCGAAFLIGRHRTLTTHGSPSAHRAFARPVP
jgi:predicted MFS family arabinose efflux permease